MKNIIKRSFQFIGLLFLFFFLFISGTLLIGMWNDYQPEAVISLKAEQNSEEKIIKDSTFSFLIWNIGYGALGKESDFFMSTEGVYWSQLKKVITDKEFVEKNVDGIAQFIKEATADFILLQEVDSASKRSYFTNEFKKIKEQKEKFAAFFADNYNIPRNPVPFFQPWNTYGQVLSGLATFSKYEPKESTRFQLPGDYPWPDYIFHLDRCAAVHRFDTDFEKELVLINIHNSAFDQGGFLKKQQMDFLKNMVESEYQKGNFIVMGGDWNMCPPGFASNTFSPETEDRKDYQIAADFMPEGWQWAYDRTVPTIRNTAHPYVKDSTYISLIDYFLVSPNLTIEKVEGMDLDFEFSDHQPVQLAVRVK